LLRAMDSLLARNRGILSPNKIKELAYDWNQEHCIPPLDDREFEKEWKQSSIFVAKGINSNITNNYNRNYNGKDSSYNKYDREQQTKIIIPIRNKNPFDYI